MSQLILGLGHKARHGKDSFAFAVEEYYAKLNGTGAKHLPGYHPVIVQRHAFANALRKEVNDFLGTHQGSVFLDGAPEVFVEDIRLPDWVKKDPNPEFTPLTPRGKHAKLLQWWGTEYRRAQDPQYWVKNWKAGINPQADVVITTDMRFLNEAAAIREIGGFTVNVVRLNADGKPYIDPTRPATHQSEIDLDGYNYDYAIHSKDAVLTGEFAITLVHFLRARATKKG